MLLALQGEGDRIGGSNHSLLAAPHDARLVDVEMPRAQLLIDELNRDPTPRRVRWTAAASY
jgi:hypothetical protein